ncbi:MAG: hypothetical protein ACRDA3_12330 [Peptostreptococcaceae bacterium]
MNVNTLPLFRDLQLTTSKYKNIQLKNNKEEVDNNRKLKSNLSHYHNKIDEINDKCIFIANKTKDDVKSYNQEDLLKYVSNLNNYSRKIYDLLKEEEIACTTTKAVMFSTLDELILINESIKNKDYILNKDSHIFLYKNITSNAFATFLALKDMNLSEDVMNAFSKSIFNQIKVISVI